MCIIYIYVHEYTCMHTVEGPALTHQAGNRIRCSRSYRSPSTWGAPSQPDRAGSCDLWRTEVQSSDMPASAQMQSASCLDFSPPSQPGLPARPLPWKVKPRRSLPRGRPQYVLGNKALAHRLPPLHWSERSPWNYVCTMCRPAADTPPGGSSGCSNSEHSTAPAMTAASTPKSLSKRTISTSL